MTIRTPSWLQAGSHPAEDDRLAQGGLWTPNGTALQVRSGVRPSGTATDLKVAAQGSPNMTVAVSPGTAVIQGTSSSLQGAYTVSSDASTNVTIPAAHATLPRIDIIVLTVQDAAYSGASNNAILQCVQGTAAASPSAPATPANSLLLADIAVAAAASSITNANITDKRVFSTALGGTLPCLSTARPGTPYEGMVVYETDTDLVSVYNGSAWKTLSDPTDFDAYSSATPTISGTGWALGNGTATVVYIQKGKTVKAFYKIVFGSTSTYGSGALTFSLPVTAASGAVNTPGSGFFYDASGPTRWVAGCRIASTTTVVPHAVNASVTYGTWNDVISTVPMTWVSTDEVNIQIEYQAA